jgi:hypothetical protein
MAAGVRDKQSIFAVLIRRRLPNGDQDRAAILVHSPDKLNFGTCDRFPIHIKHTATYGTACGQILEAKE